MAIRHIGGIGNRAQGVDTLGSIESNWFQTEWAKVCAPLLSSNPSVFSEHYPCVMGKIHWKGAYINSSIIPTQTQARDPGWSNYIWNATGTPGSGLVYDGITAALNSSQVNNGAGVGKLAILIGMTFTSGYDAPPNFIQNNSAWSWLESQTTAGGAKNDAYHARFDVTAVVDHAKWFMEALLLKFGSNTGVHSIIIDEYFFGGAPSRPGNLNVTNYRLGVKAIWDYAVSVAPGDPRVNIVQSNPQFDSNITVAAMEASGIGITESDPDLHFPASSDEKSANMSAMYNNEVVHVMINGDARYARTLRKQGWGNAPTNPFNHGSGYSEVASLEEILWYHGEKGVVPIHSFFATLDETTSQDAASFIAAFQRFGRGGTEAVTWGPSPAALTEKTAKPVITNEDGSTPVVMSPGTTMRYNYSAVSAEYGGVNLSTITQKWEQGVRPDRAILWQGPSFLIRDVHVDESFRLYFGFFNNAGNGPYEVVSEYYGPVVPAIVNTPPSVSGDISSTTLQGQQISGVLAVTDADGMTDGSYFAVVNGASGQAVVASSSGAWSFIPDSPQWTGTTTFFIDITDDQDDVTRQTITVTVNEIPDTSPAVFVGAIVSSDGNRVTVTLSEGVIVGADGANGWATTMPGVTLTYLSGSNPLVLSPSRTIIARDIGTLSYLQPGDGIKDAAGNLLGSFGGKPIANGSGESGGSEATVTGVGSSCDPIIFSWPVDTATGPIHTVTVSRLGIGVQSVNMALYFVDDQDNHTMAGQNVLLQLGGVLGPLVAPAGTVKGVVAVTGATVSSRGQFDISIGTSL